jgi:hypothetical protein
MDEAYSKKKADLKYKVYLEERKSLVEAEREQSHLFDKAILTLAGWALGLSLTFIRDIVSNHKPVQIYWLILAWLFFGASMLSTLISFLTSQGACSTQRATLEAEYFGSRVQPEGTNDAPNSAAIWTKRLNWISILTFMAGTLFLSIFSIVNLPTC